MFGAGVSPMRNPEYKKNQPVVSFHLCTLVSPRNVPILVSGPPEVARVGRSWLGAKRTELNSCIRNSENGFVAARLINQIKPWKILAGPTSSSE